MFFKCATYSEKLWIYYFQQYNKTDWTVNNSFVLSFPGVFFPGCNLWQTVNDKVSVERNRFIDVWTKCSGETHVDKGGELLSFLISYFRSFATI